MPDFNTQSIATAEKHKLADTQTIALLILKKKDTRFYRLFLYDTVDFCVLTGQVNSSESAVY
jgi:hypothetical protein